MEAFRRRSSSSANDIASACVESMRDAHSEEMRHDAQWRARGPCWDRSRRLLLLHPRPHQHQHRRQHPHQHRLSNVTHSAYRRLKQKKRNSEKGSLTFVASEKEGRRNQRVREDVRTRRDRNQVAENSRVRHRRTRDAPTHLFSLLLTAPTNASSFSAFTCSSPKLTMSARAMR